MIRPLPTILVLLSRVYQLDGYGSLWRFGEEKGLAKGEEIVEGTEGAFVAGAKSLAHGRQWQGFRSLAELRARGKVPARVNRA